MYDLILINIDNEFIIKNMELKLNNKFVNILI